ncbi:MAG: amidohydrolase family protein [Planctomycetota bacterium]|nr:amidohydrolase family protein [Planctomycetota bacterium]
MGISTLTSALAGALLLAAPAAAETPSAEAFALIADHVAVDGGTVIENGLVLVDGGKILAVGPAADLQGTLADTIRVIEHEGWLTAGIVAANGTYGMVSGADDSTRAFLGDLELRDGFDPDDSSLAKATGAGVTSFGLTSGRGNVAGGTGAVVKTSGGTMLNESSHLALCLAPPALRGNRFPTSYAGAVHAVEARFTEGQGAFGKVVAGELGLEVAVSARHEIRRALDLLKRTGLKATLRGADRAGDFAPELAEAGHAVALSPLGMGTSPWRYESITALVEAGVPFAFGLADTGSGADCLRFGAALAAREGIDRGALWNSLTASPAAMLGVSGRVGRVAAGLDADLVLWSGDPLELTTTLEAVYVDGAQVEATEGDAK